MQTFVHFDAERAHDRAWSRKARGRIVVARNHMHARGGAFACEPREKVVPGLFGFGGGIERVENIARYEQDVDDVGAAPVDEEVEERAVFGDAAFTEEGLT